MGKMWEGGRDLDGIEAVEYCDSRLLKACDIGRGNVSVEGGVVLDWDGDEFSSTWGVETSSPGESVERGLADMMSSEFPSPHARLCRVKLIAVTKRRIVVLDSCRSPGSCVW